MDIGARLREERERLGYSQEAFGAVGGVLKRAQIHYEKAERNPDAAYLAAIAAIGADVLYVLTGQYAGGVKPAPALTSEEAAMLEYFRAAPSAVRRAAIGALLGAANPTPVGVRIGNMTQRADQPGAVQVGYAGGSVTTVVGADRKKSRRKPG